MSHERKRGFTMNGLSASSLHRQVIVAPRGTPLDGRVIVPHGATGVVVLPRGPQDRQHRAAIRRVARALHGLGLATLTVNLLTPEEDLQDLQDGRFAADLDLLGARIAQATHWASEQPGLRGLPLGYYAMHATAAAALIAASEHPAEIRALVCHQGRPDLAEGILRDLDLPCLFIVAARGEEFVEMNRGAMALLRGSSELVVYDGFLMPDVVGRVATEFFVRHVCAAPH